MATNWNTLWDDVCEQLRQSGHLLLDAAPDELDRAESLRYVSRLFGNAVSSHLEPRMPSAPQLRFGGARIGGDNPDYRYGSAALNGRLAYRLYGRKNGAARIALSTFSGFFGGATPMRPTGAIDSDSPGFNVRDDGSFELLLTTTAPADSAWLPMREDTTFLLVRELRLRPSDPPAEYWLEPLSDDARDAPMSATELHQGLQNGITFVSGTVRRFLGWTETFCGRPNRVLPLPPELAGTAGDRASAYYNGYYALPDAKHALVVAFTPPPCTYWNIQAVNHWLESLDTPGTHSAYNHATITASEDGRVVVAFGPTEPGMPNWIDTAGHLHGGIVVRVVGGEQDAAPVEFSCEVVPLGG